MNPEERRRHIETLAQIAHVDHLTHARPSVWDRCEHRLCRASVETLARVEELQAEVDRLTAERDRLRDAFVRHRTATHEVKPHTCVTCHESDEVLSTLTYLARGMPIATTTPAEQPAGGGT